jgi:hypothetical protein
MIFIVELCVAGILGGIFEEIAAHATNFILSTGDIANAFGINVDKRPGGHFHETSWFKHPDNRILELGLVVRTIRV